MHAVAAVLSLWHMRWRSYVRCRAAVMVPLLSLACPGIRRPSATVIALSLTTLFGATAPFRLASAVLSLPGRHLVTLSVWFSGGSCEWRGEQAHARRCVHPGQNPSGGPGAIITPIEWQQFTLARPGLGAV
jgi:hypothetical protein